MGPAITINMDTLALRHERAYLGTKYVFGCYVLPPQSKG